MASATGIPDVAVTGEGIVGEDEPLLGRPGDASQQVGVVELVWDNLSSNTPDDAITDSPGT